jgi:nicotinate-nucleotide--dimethylbenzimidazole phosphoribosyltransferase
MTLLNLEARINEISPASDEWLRAAALHQNNLTKPPRSLGRLEETANRICAMRRTLSPEIQNPSIYIFAADHGVCAEGVNPYPQEVTRQMVLNFLRGGAAINALAQAACAELYVVDVGVAGDPLVDPRLLSRRIGPGSKNFCCQPAMSLEEALAAISLGIECAETAARNGATLLAGGDMGIGNTTVSSALTAAITGLPAEQVCGRGTGSDDAALGRKIDAVKRAVALHADAKHPVQILAQLGGFEIAALCGLCLGAALQHIPLLIDGFICTVAAVLAVRLKPAVRDYLIASHLSSEPGHALLLNDLHLEPLLRLNMRLGEGTGAALAIPIVRAAVAAFTQMATFDSAGVSGAH